MSFIDTESAVATLLNNAGFPSFRSLPDDDSMPVRVLVRKMSGNIAGPLARDNLNISVIAERDTGRMKAEAIVDVLLDGPHFIPNYGLLDFISVLSSPTELPYNKPLTNHNFDVAVDSRET